ncbi:MAG TPA: hypothetical protein VEY51_03360 [Chondromyces sp.]|nr:hypothetical protein [Chondromyces sp.]
MVTVRFFEKSSLVLSQLLNTVPAVDENIKIKGRKGKVLSMTEIKENLIHIEVVFEELPKKRQVAYDPKKKRR